MTSHSEADEVRNPPHPEEKIVLKRKIPFKGRSLEDKINAKVDQRLKQTETER